MEAGALDMKALPYTHIPCDCQYWETCRFCCADPIVAVLSGSVRQYIKRSQVKGGNHV